MKRFASSLEEKQSTMGFIGAERRIFSFTGWTLPVIALLTMLAISIPVAAGDKKTPTQLSVSATILTMIKVKIVSQPGQLQIEQKHISQGYIDIEDGSVLLISSNSPDGFMMSLACDPGLVTHVTARLSQGGTMDGESMIAVRTQQVRDEPMRVSYRLHLDPQAHVGSLPWPVALSFTPRAV